MMNLPAAKGKGGYSLNRHFMEAAVLSAALLGPAMGASSGITEEQSADKTEQAPRSLPSYPNNMPYHHAAPKADEEKVRRHVPLEPGVISNNFTAPSEGWQEVGGTKVSQLMRDIEKRANAINPKFRVVILDDDTINLRRTDNHHSFRNRLYEVLNDRNVALRWNVKSDVFSAMGGSKGPKGRVPQALRIDPQTYSESRNPLDAGIEQKNVCLVIPANADVSARHLVDEWLGEKTYTTRAEAQINPGPHAMILRTAWHETWHCLDPYFQEEGYYNSSESAVDNAYRMHRAETFAEVAAILTMAATHPHMAQFMADLRAISSDYESRKIMKGARPSDDNYYTGVVYDFTRALDLADQHIKTLGQEAITQYSMEDIARHARDITERGAYSKAELQQKALALAAGGPVSARVKQAKERLMRDTGVAVPPRASRAQQLREEEVNQVERALAQMPEATRQEIKSAITAYRAAAVAQGKLPEQGVINLIDDWRDKVQTEAPGYEAYEEKLYALSLMLAYGHLEDEIDRRMRLKASESAPEEKLSESPEQSSSQNPVTVVPKTGAPRLKSPQP